MRNSSAIFTSKISELKIGLRRTRCVLIEIHLIDIEQRSVAGVVEFKD